MRKYEIEESRDHKEREKKGGGEGLKKRRRRREAKRKGNVDWERRADGRRVESTAEKRMPPRTSIVHADDGVILYL